MGMMTEPESGIWREDLIENYVRNAQNPSLSSVCFGTNVPCITQCIQCDQT